VQTLRAAREGGGGELAPSPAVSLLERASTIRALPVAGTQAGTQAGTAGGGGGLGMKQSSLPQLEDAAKVGPSPPPPPPPAALLRKHAVHLAREGAAGSQCRAVRLRAGKGPSGDLIEPSGVFRRGAARLAVARSRPGSLLVGA
jgi:hypothetical protein